MIHRIAGQLAHVIVPFSTCFNIALSKEAAAAVGNIRIIGIDCIRPRFCNRCCKGTVAFQHTGQLNLLAGLLIGDNNALQAGCVLLCAVRFGVFVHKSCLQDIALHINLRLSVAGVNGELGAVRVGFHLCIRPDGDGLRCHVVCAGADAGCTPAAGCRDIAAGDGDMDFRLFCIGRFIR